MTESGRRRLVAIAAIGAGVATLLPSAWLAAFHCDELVALRHAGDFGRGDFGNPGRPGLLWLALAPLTWLDPVACARLGRLAAVVASALTLCGVWTLAERAESDEVGPAAPGWRGMAAVGLLATSMSWQSHSFEVRTDTFTTALSFPIALLLWRQRPSWRRAVAAGLLLGAIGLVSQKSLYNGVALAAGTAAWLGLAARPLLPGRRLATGLVVVAAAAGLVLAWYLAMAVVSGEGGDFADRNLSTAVKTAFSGTTPLASKIKYTRLSALRGIGVWALFVPGAVAAALAWRRRPALLAMVAVSLAMIGTITVHRGFWRYYIASFEPFMAVVSGSLLGGLCCWLHRRVHLAAGAGLLAGTLLGLGVAGADQWRSMLQVDNRLQIRLMRDIAEAFPDPVPYWDSIGIAPGYPETTFFGTGTTRNGVRARMGDEMYIDLARERRPRFFVREYMTRDRYMRGREQRWLWRHYVPFRPNLYLHGGRVAARKGDPAQAEVDLLVGGTFTVWFYGGWSGQAKVDGHPVAHRQEIELAEGRHRLDAAPEDKDGQLWVILGAGRQPGTDRVSEHRDYSMYPPLLRHRYQLYDRTRKSPSDLLSPPWSPGLPEHEFEARARRHGKVQERREERMGGRQMPRE